MRTDPIVYAGATYLHRKMVSSIMFGHEHNRPRQIGLGLALTSLLLVKTSTTPQQLQTSAPCRIKIEEKKKDHARIMGIGRHQCTLAEAVKEVEAVEPLIVARSFLALAFLVDSSSVYVFHLRQPSKSISACMQPHSMTFLSSHTYVTG